MHVLPFRHPYWSAISMLCGGGPNEDRLIEGIVNSSDMVETRIAHEMAQFFG